MPLLLQSTSVAVVLLLLGGTAARAQPEPPRVPRQRTITLTGDPADPVPEVHGAPGVVTTFLFDAPLIKASVQVDAARLRVLDVGTRSLLVEPMTGLREGERTEVRVLFADGAPARAVFVLVAHPSEVDTRIDVTRREPPPEAHQVPCDAPSPIAFRLADMVGAEGIQVRAIKKRPDNADSFESEGGLSFLGKSWALMDVRIRNASGQPWLPRGGVLKSRTGHRIDVRQVHVKEGQIAPGKSQRVLVETDVPSSQMGTDFTLHLQGEDGRFAIVPDVELPPRAKESR